MSINPTNSVLINQLQFYTPPKVIQQILSNPKTCLQVAKMIIDREYKSKPTKWKTTAFPEYEDFFQAAISGYNPYKKESIARDKGMLQAVEFYNPYKKQEEVDGEVLIQSVNDVEQAICPFCFQRDEVVSLWPYSAGNPLPKEFSPEPLFAKGHKYCGRVVANPSQEAIDKELVRQVKGNYFCNYKSRLASLKNYILSQINFLVQDIRSAEYHSSRTLKRHPFYPCPQCGTLTPDFNKSSVNKPTHLKCTECNHKFNLKQFEGKKSDKIVWQARNSMGNVSFDDSSEETEGRATYEDIISNYALTSIVDNPAVYHNKIEEEKEELHSKLIDRIRELAATSLTKKQLDRLLKDPLVPKVDGIPETQNFLIFYEYWFMDDIERKKNHLGKTKDSGDESSTYRDLALKYLKKEQHYTRCLDCNHKMYEPTESAKFKKLGTKQACDTCSSVNIKYHGPKCGHAGSLDPLCTEHGEVEITMYIFQTIEPKIRRLEEMVQNDDQAKEIFEKIQELLVAKEQIYAHQDMVRLLNF